MHDPTAPNLYPEKVGLRWSREDSARGWKGRIEVSLGEGREN